MSFTESRELVFVNKGKFGSVGYLKGSNHAFKTVHTDSTLHRDELWKEFWIGVDVHRDFSSTLMAFSSPAYSMYGTPELMKDRQDRSIKITDIPPEVQAISKCLPRTTVTLEFLPFLPLGVTPAYRSVVPDNPSVEDVRMIRLYLGRIPGSTMASVQHSSQTDHPVDIIQYRMLREVLLGSTALPTAEEVCEGMGRMLGRLHWAVGVDGRDCEICLTGDGAGGTKLVILDFNMCQRWLVRRPLEMRELDPRSLTTGGFANNDLCSGAVRLARLIANCESFYPRPRQTDVYPLFKSGYLRGVADALNQFAPVVGDSEGDFKRHNDMTVGFKEGLDAFFDEYELLDREKVARWRSRAQKLVV